MRTWIAVLVMVGLLASCQHVQVAQEGPPPLKQSIVFCEGEWHEYTVPSFLPDNLATHPPTGKIKPCIAVGSYLTPEGMSYVYFDWHQGVCAERFILGLSIMDFRDPNDEPRYWVYDEQDMPVETDAETLNEVISGFECKQPT